MEIIIRKELPEDYFESEALTRRAFFNKNHIGCDEHLLVHKIRNHVDYLPECSRVAVVNGKVVGLIMYTKAYIVTETDTVEIVTFGPLCVDHRFKNHGIGRRLLEETIPLVKEAGYPGILLFGEPEYYPKRGFKRAGEFGLTTMEGETGDYFLGYELAEGGLSIPGGRFMESDVFTDLPKDELEEFEKKFEFLGKTVRPCQWEYDNATEEEQGYHMDYAINHPREFIAMYRKYIEALSEYDKGLVKCNIELAVNALWADISKATYVIYVGDTPAGLLVTSAPETAEEEYTGFLEEIFVDEPFRRRGIGSDVFYRYFRQQNGAAGYCVINTNKPAAERWWKLLTGHGMKLKQYPAGDSHSCYVVTKEKAEVSENIQ